MKIAVATVDGVSVSQHFGQSAGFIVFEVEGSVVKSRELRTNNGTPHAQGICNHGEPGQSAPHNHGGIAGLLQDCQIMLCGGMGAGAANALQQMGVQPVVAPSAGTADELVALYLQGAVQTAPGGLCACHH